MRCLMIAITIFLIVIGGWFVAWRSMMADDVALVQASIKHHSGTIKAATPTANFKVDGIAATGFPFRFRVALHRPTLTQIWDGESYAVSFEKIELEKSGNRYRVIAPAQMDAMYAKSGSAPERYRITLNEVPALLLKAKEGREPFTEFAAQLPRKLVLDVELNGQTKQIGFDFMPLNIPVFMPMPADVGRPLQIFVSMLREAMVFQP